MTSSLPCVIKRIKSIKIFKFDIFLHHFIGILMAFKSFACTNTFLSPAMFPSQFSPPKHTADQDQLKYF